MIDEGVKTNIRMTIAAKCIENNCVDLEMMEKIAEFVVGKQSNILPVSKFEVVNK